MFPAAGITQVLDYTEYNGTVEDVETNDPLVSVSIKLSNTNLGSITNDEGGFTIKVPNDRGIDAIEFSLLGYETKRLLLSQLTSEKNKIQLVPVVTELSQINISTYKSAKALVMAVFNRILFILPP